jgi:hypothetical protein
MIVLHEKAVGLGLRDEQIMATLPSSYHLLEALSPEATVKNVK